MKLKVFLFTSLFIGPLSAAAEDWQLDGGIGYYSFTVHNLRGETKTDSRPQISFGAYKVVSEKLRYGVSIASLINEATNWRASTNTLVVRLADIDYRLSDNFAVTGNVGFARYYREQSSYGYSYGGGGKYRLSESWYLMVDIGYANVDLSTNVPGNQLINTKDNLKWYGLQIRKIF